MKVLVLEGSTASAKAMLYDSEQGILRTEGKTYPAEVCDIVTQDADGMVAAILEAGRAAAAGEEIAAVALSGIWHSYLVCDGAMRPKTRVQTWAYLGAADQAAEIRKDAALKERIYQKTGCAVHAMYPLYKAMRLRNEGQIAAGDRYLGQGDYLFYRLTGEFLTSDCLASGSGLLNLKEREYDAELLELCGLSREQLPAVGSFESTASLSAEAAKALGLPAGIPVVPCHSDGAMNQVGAGALKKGVMTFSVGTSAAIRLTVDHPVTPENGGTWCYIAPGKYLSGAATQGSTNCVDWFMKTVLKTDRKYSELENAAKYVLDNPYFLPFLFGERCPGWQDGRRGGFYQLAGSHDECDLFYAILEGVLFNVYHCFDILQKNAYRPDVIKVSGGVLKSPMWSKMLVDIWQQPITAASNEQASMLGGAALALHAAGALPNIEEFGDRSERVIEPDPAMADYYKTRFTKYLELYCNK